MVSNYVAKVLVNSSLETETIKDRMRVGQHVAIVLHISNQQGTLQGLKSRRVANIFVEKFLGLGKPKHGFSSGQRNHLN